MLGHWDFQLSIKGVANFGFIYQFMTTKERERKNERKKEKEEKL